MPPPTPTEVSHTVAQVHKFGAASEAVFRRLYRGLHGRGDVQEHLRQQQELSSEQARRNAEPDGRQPHLQPVLRSRAGAFDIKREAVSIEDFLWSVVRGMNPELRARGIDLLVMTRGIGGLQIRGDDKCLQWALGHLLRNGAQYNRRGGHVALSARTSAIADRAYVSIRVADNGVGIGEKDLPHIFERFYRGDSSRAEERQSGQGLYAAKAICEAHGGFLRVRSRPNVGSAFTMGLPLQE